MQTHSDLNGLFYGSTFFDVAPFRKFFISAYLSLLSVFGVKTKKFQKDKNGRSRLDKKNHLSKQKCSIN